MSNQRKDVGLHITIKGRIVNYYRNVSKEALVDMLPTLMEKDPVLKEVVEKVGRKPDFETTLELHIPSDSEMPMLELLKLGTKMEPGKFYMVPKGIIVPPKGGEE